jgi:hypothetical protein
MPSNPKSNPKPIDNDAPSDAIAVGYSPSNRHPILYKTLLYLCQSILLYSLVNDPVFITIRPIDCSREYTTLVRNNNNNNNNNNKDTNFHHHKSTNKHNSNNNNNNNNNNCIYYNDKPPPWPTDKPPPLLKVCPSSVSRPFAPVASSLIN